MEATVSPLIRADPSVVLRPIRAVPEIVISATAAVPNAERATTAVDAKNLFFIVVPQLCYLHYSL
jgi:hypothetical protein